MGTRVIDPQPLIFDHAAQFFTVNDSRFSELLDDWLLKGLVQEWQGIIGELHNGGHFVPFPPSPSRYIGTNGMRPLAHSLLSQVIKRSTKISDKEVKIHCSTNCQLLGIVVILVTFFLIK